MSDLLLEQLAHGDGPVDPGPRFRAQLWDLVDAELDAVASGTEPVATVLDFTPVVMPPAAPPVRRRGRSGLAWVRASRVRTVSIAASLVTLLAIGAGAYLLGEDPDAEQSIQIVDDGVPPRPPSVGTLPLPTLLPPPIVSPPQAGGPSVAGLPPRTRTGESPGARPTLGLPGAAAGRPGARPRQMFVMWSDVRGTPDSHIYQTIAGSEAEPTVLIGGPNSDFMPVPSPDGRHVFWSRSRPGSAGKDIWTATVDGEDRRRVTPLTCGSSGDCVLTWPTVSPDGGRLAFSRGTGSTGCTAAEQCDELVVFDLRSGAMTAVGFGEEADWSPRRNEIVYGGHESAAGRNTACAPQGAACPGGEIRIVDLSGPTPVSRIVGGETAGHSPRFSPDGEWIAFERSFTSGKTIRESVVMRRDGSQKRVLSACYVYPTWTPDGRLACGVLQGSSDSDVFLLDADDQPVEQLTFTPEMEYYSRLYFR